MNKTHIIEGIEFSEETVKGWAKQCGISFEKKFVPVRICHLEIGINGATNGVAFSAPNGNNGPGNIVCVQAPEAAKDSIMAIQSAIDFIEK